MASTTPKNQRKRLTNDEKKKIIEDSKNPGFCRKKVMEKYGISRSAISVLLAKQKRCLFYQFYDFTLTNLVIYTLTSSGTFGP